MMELRASLILTKSDTLSLSYTLSPCCSEYLSIFSACVHAPHAYSACRGRVGFWKQELQVAVSLHVGAGDPV